MLIGACGVAAEPAGDSEPVELYFLEATRPGHAEMAARIGRRILAESRDDALTLDSLAWGILTDETVLVPDMALAVEAARRAHELTQGEDVQVIETLARALVMKGKRDEGIALHRTAIARCDDDPSTRLVLKEILAEYLAPPIDLGPTDERRIQGIEAEMRRLVEAGKGVPVDDLLARTDVGPCRVNLAAPGEQPLAPVQLFERVRPSVVVMAALEPVDDGHHEVALASGFVIDTAGIVATNYHVVDVPGSPILVAMTADGAIHPVIEILAVSPRDDLAVCRIAATGLPALPVVVDARPGLRLHALSHPDAAFYSFTDGILSRSFVHRADGQAKTMFSTTVDFAVGSSGGPLVDDRGNVVGIVSSTLAVYAGEEESAERRDGELPPGDFQMGLNMCVPGADILRLVGGGQGAAANPSPR